MSTKEEFVGALEEILDICSSDDPDPDEVGQIAADVLGEEWPPEEEDDIEID